MKSSTGHLIDNLANPKSVEFQILGQPYSKANSRRLVTNRRTGRPMFIKSDAAFGYAKAFKLQCPKLPALISGDISFTAHIYYGSRRPDLDESLLMDLCQGLIYENDRQIKAKHIFGYVDKNNPRSVIKIEVL